MTKDFKHTDGSSYAGSRGQYGISWMLGGIAIGLLVGIGLYAFANKTPDTQQAAQGSATASNVASTDTTLSPDTASTLTDGSSSLKDTPDTTDERPGFSYHALLPELDFTPDIPIVNEVNPNPTPQKKQQETKPAEEKTDITRSGNYMFQIGAFRTASQAKQRQQRLQQIGLNTRVEEAQVRGSLWYRVRLGPSKDLKIVNRWQQTLQRSGLDYTKIRL